MRKLIAWLLLALMALSALTGAMAEPAATAAATFNGGDAVRTTTDLYFAIPNNGREMLLRVPLNGGDPICVDRADSFENLLPYGGGVAYLKTDAGSSAIAACNGNDVSNVYSFGVDSASDLAYFDGKMLVLINGLLHSIEPATQLCLRLSGAQMLDFVLGDGCAYYLSEGDRMEYTAQLEGNQTVSTQAGCVYRLDLSTGETTLLLKSGGTDLKIRDYNLYFHNLADAYAVRAADSTMLLGRVYSMDVQLKSLNGECTEPDNGFWPLPTGVVVWHSGALNLDTEAGNLALYSPENGATVVSDGEYLYVWEAGKQSLTQLTATGTAQTLYTGDLAQAMDASLIIPETVSLTTADPNATPAPGADQAATGNDAWFDQFMDNANSTSNNNNSTGSYKPQATPIGQATPRPSTTAAPSSGSNNTGNNSGSSSSSSSNGGTRPGDSYSVSISYLRTTADVNLRAKGGTSASILGSIPGGTVVKCTGKASTASNGAKWYQVKYDGVTGWISAAYAEKTSSSGSSSSGNEVSVSGKYVRVTGGNVTIRKSANKDSKALGSITEGTTVTFLGKQSTDSRGVKWFKVKYDGVTGWVSSKYAMVTDSSAGSSGDEVKIVGGDVTIRAKANKNSKSLGYIPEGKRADYLGKSSTDDRGVKWYKIEYKGITGWVSSIYADRV